MERKDALAELIAKVEAGDATNDGSMFRAFGDKWTLCYDAFNGSLDAAMALHEAVLPGWRWVLRDGDDEDTDINAPHGGPDKFFANVWAKGNPNYGVECFTSWADTSSRAWLLSILKALHEQETGT